MRNTILSLPRIAPLRQTVLEDFDRYIDHAATAVGPGNGELRSDFRFGNPPQC